MYYYASLNSKGVCYDVSEYEEEQQTNAYCVQLDSLDTSLVFRKKYVDGEWVDCLPSETDLPMSDRLGYSPTDEWLSDVLGNITNLSTENKTSLVSAVNECFQSASDGKTAIANAITGIDESITIPDNPTFIQLASLIGQISTMKIATGHMQAYTSSNTTIAATTPFRPRVVAFYNNQSGSTNFNAGLYVDSNYLGLTKADVDVQDFSDINFNAWGVSGGGRAENVFTITDTGFTATVTGLCTNIGWIALG